MVEITVRMTNLPKVKAVLEEQIRRLIDAHELLDEIGSYMVRSTQIRLYRDKKSPEGDPWAENRESTVRRKGHGNILIDSGDMARGIEFQQHHMSVTIESNESYSGYMQEGFHAKNGEWIAPREFLGVSDTNNERIRKIIRDYLKPAY